MKKFNKAIENYDLAIQFDPKYLKAYFNKGGILENLGEFKKAIEIYD